MATTTPNFGWAVPTSTDLVKDGAVAIETLGDSIDASLVDLKGGTTGQVLAKATNTDMDFTWVAADDTNAIQNAIVDAKGDLIAATANDTPARLAVGNNGETLVADSSTSTGLRWQGSLAAGKNAFTNGNMDVWQRGTSFAAVGTGIYGADRWKCTVVGSGLSLTMSQDTSVPNNNSKYSLKFQQLTTSATVSDYAARQVIEQSNTLPLLGKTITISFWYRSNRTGNHAIRCIGSINTGGTDDSVTFAVSAANTWEFKSITFTSLTTVSAPSADPTAAGLIIDLGFYAGLKGISSLSANDYFQFTQAQLEIGSVATTFTRSSGTIQGELAACQRYYWRDTSLNTASYHASAISNQTTAAFCLVNNPVQMRLATPVSMDYANLELTLPGSTNYSITGLTIEAARCTALVTSIKATGAVGLVNGMPYFLVNSSSAGYLGFSAEL